MTSLLLFNTFTRSIEPFVPLQPKAALIYSCGPTVYARQHLGNLRTYLFSDLLKRTLLQLGFSVRHVINITDVGHLTDDADAGEDKIERAARTQGATARELSKHWTELFQKDLQKLAVLAPDVWCWASHHIAEQIAMIEELDRKGFVYQLDDGLYFDTAKDPNYGKLGRLEPSAERTRVQATQAKRSPADFALWKFSPKHGPRRQLEWRSPWGLGFPGWHIECSAMATKYLGNQFDIHTGGVDHIPVHHENEIAQSENALGVRPWARYWMHAGWLLAGGAKLSKSNGHTPSLDELQRAGFEPMAFRYYTLTAHYRKPLEFNWTALDAARRALHRLNAIRMQAAASPALSGERTRLHRKRFFDALLDDLNAPLALSALWEAARDRELSEQASATLVGELANILGLDLAMTSARHCRSDDAPGSEIQVLMEERERARQQRDYALADVLREKIRARGVELEDTLEGPRWRWMQR